MAEDKHRSFFTTLPGILTGIAALISAGTGLYVALREPSDSQTYLQNIQVAPCRIAGLVFDVETNDPLSGVWVDLYRDLSRIQQRHVRLEAGAATTGPDGRFSINCNAVPESKYPLRLALRHHDWVATHITGQKIPSRGDWEGIRIPLRMSEVDLKPLREISVSFSVRKIGDAMFLVGQIENTSDKLFKCIKARFNMTTSSRDTLEGRPERHVGFLDVQVRDLKPHETRDYRKKLPGRVGISLHSKEECADEG